MFRKYWPKLQLHHDMGKWQDDECIYLKSHVERGEWFEIEDFGENYHIERKREHQSYYFSEIGVSLHGNMLRICVEDLSDEYLGPGQFPPSPLYTHIYIGPFPFPLSLPLIKVTSGGRIGLALRLFFSIYR